MSKRVSQLKQLLDQLPGLLEELSDDVWKSIDHNNPEELQTGVAFKQRYNQQAERLLKASRDFTALLDEELDIQSVEGDDQVRLSINPDGQSSDLNNVSEFLSRASMPPNRQDR